MQGAATIDRPESRMTPPDHADYALSLPLPNGRAAADERVLHRLADNVATVGRRDRLTIDIGPFRAFLSPGLADDMMSFAVPTVADADWGAAIGPLSRAFTERERVPRLEHFAELQTGLAAALERAGLDRLSRQQAMVTDPASLKRRPLPTDAVVRFLDPDRPDRIVELMALQQVAFGLPAGAREDSEWRTFLERAVADGTVLAAMVVIDGTAVSCAGLQIGGGGAEVTGVATRPGWRRRGLAAALCSLALDRFFAQGYDLAWLSAADPVAGAVYRRIGFRPVGTLLTHGVPRRSDADVRTTP